MQRYFRDVIKFFQRTFKNPCPLSGRTLKYGRNVLAAGMTSLVLIYMPGINIKDFQPFGFKFTDDSVASSYIILGTVLLYYAVMFAIGADRDRMEWNESTEHKSPFSRLQGYIDIQLPLIVWIVATLAIVYQILFVYQIFF